MTTKFYNTSYIINIPTETATLAQKDYEIVNNRIIDALASALSKGHVSKLDRVFLEQINSPKMRAFCKEVFDEIDKNCKNNKVRVNFAGLGRFLVDKSGIALVTKLNQENKILNWTNIVKTLSNPSYDFSDSDMIEYLGKVSKDLNNTYSKDNNYKN